MGLESRIVLISSIYIRGNTVKEYVKGHRHNHHLHLLRLAGWVWPVYCFILWFCLKGLLQMNFKQWTRFENNKCVIKLQRSRKLWRLFIETGSHSNYFESNGIHRLFRTDTSFTAAVYPAQSNCTTVNFDYVLIQSPDVRTEMTVTILSS